MKKRNLVFILAAVITMACIAGCGAESESGSGNSQSVTNNVSTTKEPTVTETTKENSQASSSNNSQNTTAVNATSTPVPTNTPKPTSTPKPTQAVATPTAIAKPTVFKRKDDYLGLYGVNNEATIFSWLKRVKTDNATINIACSANRWSEIGEIDESTLKITIATETETYTISSGYFAPYMKWDEHDKDDERFNHNADYVLRFDYSQIQDSAGKVYDTEGILTIYFSSYETTIDGGNPVEVVTWYDTSLGKDEFMKNKYDTILITPYGNAIEFHAGQFENTDCSVYINHNYLDLERYVIWIQAPNNESGFVTEGHWGFSNATVTPGSQRGDYFTFTFTDEDGLTGVFTFDVATMKATLTHPSYNNGNTFELEASQIR